MTLGFKVLSERPGYANRPDICLELPGRVYVIIGLKFSLDKNEAIEARAKAAIKKLTIAERNKTLAMAARTKLSPDEINESLAKLALVKLDEDEIDRILYTDGNNTTESDRNRLLANAVRKTLSKDEINNALATLAESSLSKEDQNKALLESIPLPDYSVDAVLTKAAKQSLSDIKKRGYQGPVKGEAKEIIELGLAIHAGDASIKAVFGQGYKGLA
jgi:DNA anti-recombination protein RmuC